MRIIGELIEFLSFNFINIIFAIITIIHNKFKSRKLESLFTNVLFDIGLPLGIYLVSFFGTLQDSETILEVRSFYGLIGVFIFGAISFIYHYNRKNKSVKEEQEQLVEMIEEENDGELNQEALERYLSRKKDHSDSKL